ncbi:SH3 domain-containing protein [Halomonas sp. WWR20]
MARLLIGLVLSGIATALPAAELVFIQGQENGQGVLRIRNAECFAIVPEHVVGHGLGLFVVTADRTQAPAEISSSFGEDIAILRVHSRGKIDCGVGWLASTDLDTSLQKAVSAGQTGTIVRVRATGGVESYPVRFHAYDDRYVDIVPLGEDITLFQGISGSRLLLDGLPVGMVMSVDAEQGLVRAYRQDALAHLVSRFFDTAGPTQMPAIEQPIEPLKTRAMISIRTAIREEPSAWSPVVRWLRVGHVIEITGKVKGAPWLRTEEGYVSVNGATLQ